MSQVYNIYCDESGHLENDKIPVMVLGAIWCPLNKTREISGRFREIKSHHGLSQNFELKWVKVSMAKHEFYQEIMDYFFDNNDLHFRALIVPDKSKLRHVDYNQTHDDWFYKMYFDMLKIILSPTDRYRIYLDIKDTRSETKIKKLHEVLSNNMYDFSREIIERVQSVRSNEVEQLQLTDFLIGAIAYINKGLKSNYAKMELTRQMRQRSGYTLTQTTLLRENKVNIFRWHAKE